MTFQYIPIPPGSKTEDLVEKEARRKLSPSVYVDRKSHQKDKDYFEFGICTPRVIIDSSEAPLIRYVCIDGIFSASTKRVEQRLLINLPSRKEIADKFHEKQGALIRRAENILVENLGDKLIQIPKVQNGLNPIKEILLALHDLGDIPVSELRARMDIHRTVNYLKFLEDLEFIRLENDTVYPGNEMTKYDIADIDFGNIILKDVLLRGFRFLTENLSIYILTPYLELSNAYYLQSHYADKLLKLDHKEISRHYEDMYGRARHKPEYQTYSNLLEIRQAHILQGEKSVFYGSEETFNKFQAEMVQC